jgi:hypothetical protein
MSWTPTMKYMWGLLYFVMLHKKSTHNDTHGYSSVLHVHVAEHQLTQTVRLRREQTQGDFLPAADLYAGVLNVAPHNVCVCVCVWNIWDKKQILSKRAVL